MQSSNFKKALPFFLTWTAINLLQACFSELIHDEAYYWVFARHLAWGYFEQPPAVAFFIYLGQFLPGELGVRIWFVFLSVFTVFWIWKTTDVNDNKLFFIMLAGIVIIHVGGFVAVPDVTLLFFVSLFFLLLKNYLEKDSWFTAFLLALAVCGMSYSKYHAAIVLLFAFLPNIRLALRPSFWLTIIIPVLLYLPHIFWQLENDFPPIRYHLNDRLAEPYTLLFPVNYILGQLLVFGPLGAGLLFWSAWKAKSENQFEKTLKWSLYGIFGFFFVLSLKGRVEANWTASAIIPLAYFTYHYAIKHHNFRKWLIKLSLASLVIISAFRVYFVVDFLPEGWNPRNEFHHWDEWADDISKAAGDLPVVFNNAYQRTSKYWFYSKKFTHSTNFVQYAGNQYDLLTDNEELLQEQTVMRLNPSVNSFDSLQLGRRGKMPYKIILKYYSFNRIKIKVLKQDLELPPNTKIQLRIRIYNPTQKKVYFKKNGMPNVRLHFNIFKFRKPVKDGIASISFPIPSLDPGQSIETSINFESPADPGDYRFRIAIITDDYHGRNTNFNQLSVVSKK